MLALEIKKLAYTSRLLEFSKKDHQTPEYLALNPRGKVPTLKDGDFVLWESGAIMQYLAARRPESGLLPKDERARLDVTRWQFWDVAHWDPACSVFLFEYVVKPVITGAGEPDSAAIAKGAEAFHRAAKVLDGQLKGKSFVLGEQLTLADFSLGAVMNYAEMAKFPLEPYAEIKRWSAGVRALPAWQTTLAQSMPVAAAA
jgi:glutathione S-transferase